MNAQNGRLAPLNAFLHKKYLLTRTVLSGNLPAAQGMAFLNYFHFPLMTLRCNPTEIVVIDAYGLDIYVSVWLYAR